jgi:hypothetical protein
MFNFRKTQIAQEEILLEQDRLKAKKGKQKQSSGNKPQGQQQPVERIDRVRDPVAEDIVESKLLDIQQRQTKNHPNGFPIYEVIKNLSEEKESNNLQGGYSSFWKILKAAENGDLLKPGTEYFNGFKNAIAETIVYDLNKQAALSTQAPLGTLVFHDPVKKDPITGEAGLISFLITDASPSQIDAVSRKITDSMGKFTPDMLVVSPSRTLPTQYGSDTYGAVIPNIVDPTDPTGSRIINDQRHIRKTLIAPMEITIARDLGKMQDKVKKFESYKNPFIGSPIIDYVPIVVLDKDMFMKEKPDRRARLVARMTAIGGVIQLIDGLNKQAEKKALAYAPEIITAVKEHRKQQAETKELDSKQNIEKSSLSNRLFSKSKEWFKNIKQSFASNKKNPETTNTKQKGRLASEVYQEMTSSLKQTASYSQEAGIDVINNSNHLDLMLAKELAKKDAAYEKVLKQSPNYRSKEPSEAKVWFENMLKDGISLSKEYHFDSDGSQKIIRSYDNDASRPPEKSDFEKLSKSVQKYNSSYATDRQGLLVAVATAAMDAGMNPEQVLRQSPDYLSAMSGKGEALIEKTVEKAESAVQAERSRVEQQAQRDSQRDSERER